MNEEERRKIEQTIDDHLLKVKEENYEQRIKDGKARIQQDIDKRQEKINKMVDDLIEEMVMFSLDISEATHSENCKDNFLLTVHRAPLGICANIMTKFMQKIKAIEYALNGEK